MDAVSAAGVVRSLMTQLAAFQSLLLLASGLHKLLRFDRTGAAVRDFAQMPRSLAPAVAAAAAGGELLAAVLLWMPSLRAAGGALAMIIWGGYLILMLRAVAQGRSVVDCGCSFGPAHRPLGTYQVVRNAALTASALLVAAGAAAGAAGGAGPDAGMPVPQILAASALLALYVALDQAMALAPPRAGELL